MKTKWIERFQRAWPTMASALLMALAFPPVNLSLLVLVCLAPWLAYLRDTDSRGARRSGYLFGFLTFLFQMFWIVPFVNKWTGNLVLGIIPWLVTAFITGWFFMLAGWLIHVCWKRGWWWLIPFAWAGMEAFRAYIPGLSFPWANLAHPLWMYPAFVQHAAFGTIFFVSAWLMIPNILVANWMWVPKVGKPIPGQPVFRAAIVFILLFMGSTWRFTTMPPGVVKSIAVGQPGIDMAFSEPEDEERMIQERIPLMAASAKAYGASLLILPEGMVHAGPILPPFNPLGAKPLMPVIFGGHRHVDDTHDYQSAFVYDGNWSVADKTRLVVFGEYVPFRDILPLGSFKLPSGDLRPAEKLVTPSVNGMKIGALICFEGLFPDLGERHQRQGAQAFAAMCIDDWYIDTNAWDQLWQSTVWRSIEAGAPTFRSAALGKSMIIDARGRIVTEAKKKEMAVLRADVLIPAQPDGWSYRFAFVWICWAVMGFVGVFEIFATRREKKRAAQAE
jgi:apolipoprotein N-acyltransferase